MVSALEKTTTTQCKCQGLVLKCPRCHNFLKAPTNAAEPTRACSVCDFVMMLRNGIWCALPPERFAYFSNFIADYELIRAAEGRASHYADYYLALPYRDLSGNNSEQWTIRACTYSYLVKHILPKVKTHAGEGARVLDVGAGNGWLSYRLTQRGFRPVALDLLVNDQDGLGAARHFETQLGELFPRFQAEIASLPFADCQFDAVIFNASFHYTENYKKSLREAMRCLRIGGTIIIADSPWYSKHSSGERMVVERQAAFLNRFGTPSDSIPSLEFLTDARLAELEHALGIRWERHQPFYGIRWALRPLIARLRCRREPSRFRIYSARKPG
jgi:SAM-dependent methyltransferase